MSDKEVVNNNIPQGNNAVLNAFKQKFATAVNQIYINSQKKTVGFREVTVNEQKTLSKTTIQNEGRKDVIYDAQCDLINSISLDKDFDIYKATEFDRIRILLEVYQSNYFKNEVHYKCHECGCENVYKLDFQKIINKLNDFTLDDVIFTYQDQRNVYNFTINYPSVRSVSRFYHEYMKKYGNVSVKERQALDDMSNVEYINLFIKQIEMIDKDNPADIMNADLRIMTGKEVETLFSYFPQNVLFSTERGVLQYITKEFIEKLNNVFNYEKCAQCGAESKEGIGNVIDFF